MDTKDNEKEVDVKVTPEVETAPQVDLVDAEPIKAAMEPAVPAAAAAATAIPVASASNRSLKLTILSILIVVVALVGIVYLLERENRIDTNFFGGMIAAQQSGAAVAVVNGQSIATSELEETIGQLEQAATAQGANLSDPAVQAQIRTQALDLVVGTELLMQTAADAGVEASDETVAARLAEIEAEAGGADTLAERMAEFGISMETLEADVRSELIIRQLLESALEGEDVAVSEEEVLAAYDGAGGLDAGLPPFADVQPQIIAQLSQAKEQVVIDAYIAQLRADADIEIIE